MKVNVTLHFNREDRLAVANYFGEAKPADYDEMKSFIDRTINGELETLVGALDDRRRREADDPPEEPSPLETVR